MSQSGLAFSAEGQDWFLINASPDLRSQIESFPALHPRGPTPRHSPIQGVLLTNADLDHTLGLFLLREGDALPIHATATVRQTLTDGLRMDQVLNAYGGVRWHEPSWHEFATLRLRNGESSGIGCRAIPLSSSPPLYLRDNESGTQSIAWEIREERTGRAMVVAPDVERVTAELEAALRSASLIFFDGTFWSNDEMQIVKGSSRTAVQMGHLPVRDYSLELLRDVPASRKFFLHINNTNPMLVPDGPERREITAAGWAVAHDGLDLEL